MQDIAFDLWNQSIPEPASGAGAVAPGGFATTPTDNAYRFAAAAPDTGSAGPVAALMSGNKWTSFDATAGKTIVTYSFADPAASVFNYRGTENYSSTLSAFSAADRALVRQVLDRIESVANVEFVEVRDDALQCGVVR
jgi:hypothetical protein